MVGIPGMRAFFFIHDGKPWELFYCVYVYVCVCVALFLLNRYWGIVTVPGSFLKSGDLGWPDPHPPPYLRRWLHRSPPFPLRTDPQLLR